jgi:gliding motility-associated-like protein
VSYDSSNADCSSSNGSITVSISSGVANYKYELYDFATSTLLSSTSTSSASNVFGSLANKIYTIKTYDNNGSNLVNTQNVYLKDLSVSVLSQTTVSCFGGTDGQVTLKGAGGTQFSPSGYYYKISSGTWGSSNVLSGFAAGTYSLQIQDFTGCVKSISVTIIENSQLSFSVTSKNNVSCYNGSNGSFQIVANGGVTPYKYKINSGTLQVSNLFSSLTAGNYSVVVEDNLGCQTSNNTTITQPTQISLVLTTNNITCNGLTNGSVSLSPSGGTAPYTYSWAGTGSVSGVTATTASMTNLAAGTYNYVVTDANGCNKSGSATVQEPSIISVSAKAKTSVSCNGGSNGAVNITVTGGSPIGSPIYQSFAWSGPSGFTASTQNITGLKAGRYDVTITDANSCTGTDSVLISEPTAISIANTKVDVLCNGNATGSIDITTTGGIGTHTYSWIGPGTFSSTSEDITNLAAGSYTVTVTDANSCVKTSTVVITEPTAISISSTQVNVLCNGASTASIDLTVSGGTPTYSAAWTGPSSYTASTEDLSLLAAGTYNVTITDNNLCTKTSSVTITEPTKLTLSSTKVDLLCNGASTGSIALTISGGVSTYSKSWTGPSSYTSTNEDISTLSAGNYSVTVTDANSCTETLSTTITEPTAIAASDVITNVTCNGLSDGGVNLTVSGGTVASNYTFAWDNSATTEDITGVLAGNYQVTITDDNGCTFVKTYTVTEPAVLSIAKTITKVLCNGNADGGINLTITGGTATYSYSWTGPNTFTANTEDITALLAGDYDITVTDLNNCQISDKITVTEPTAMALGYVRTEVKCKNENNGAIDLTVVGGTVATDYIYDWASIKGYTSAVSDISNLVADEYTYTITDDNGCVLTDTINISEPALLGLNIATVSVCDGQGTLTFNAYGGTSPYTYMVDRVSATSPVTNLPDKVYEVYTTDFNNCRDSVLVNLVHNDGILPTVATKNITVYLDNAGSASILTSQINNGSFDNCSIDTLYLDKYNFNCSNTGANTVTLTVVDINGNSKTKTATVTVLDTISPTITVQNATITVDTSGNAYLLENMVVVTYNDNCSKDTITLSKNVFVVADKGINNVNVTITDPSGNTVVKTVKVTVVIGDSDNDSIPDYIEKNFDTDSDGKMNYVDVDSDNDGILDIVENDSNKTYQDFDGDGRPNSLDLDSDNDGINDVIEADVIDANGDGVKDNLTVFISNPNNQDLTGNPDYLDLDSDDDGLFDAYESKQNYTDSNKDGIIDGVDTDGDGILEFADGSGLYKDAFDVAPVDSDGDLIGDWRDKDSDGDKIPDAVELSADKDSDGMPNYLDRDSDNDSIPDAIEAGIDPNNPLNSDTDADPNYLDTDSDGDKISDNLEAGANPKSPVDTDSDTKADYIDTDSDGDTITDAIEAGTDATNPTDTDNDGIYDFRETDSDDDGILDSVEVGADATNPVDTDGDLLPDYRDLDSDGDGISDKIETGNDFDADGKANYIDTDADNDELLDNTEGTADDDGDGKPNYLDSDVTIPEGFSPNNDGDNDLLVIKGLKVFTKAEITVFNRNGQVVYESGQGYKNNWDGTNKGVNPSLGGTTLPEGIYFYVFKYNGQNNQPISGNLYIKP